MLMLAPPSDEELLGVYALRSLNPTGEHDCVAYPEFDYLLEIYDPFSPASTKPSQQAAADSYNLLVELLGEDTTLPEHTPYSQTDDTDPLTGEPLVPKLRAAGAADKAYLYPLLKEFKAARFLRKLHGKDTVEQLQQQMGFLSHQIELQSQALQQLIDLKYLQFVRLKNGIDRVLDRFHVDPDAQPVTREQKVTNKYARGATRLPEPTADFNLVLIEEGVKKLTFAALLVVKPLTDKKREQGALQQAIEFVEQHTVLFDLPLKIGTSVASGRHQEVMQHIKTYHKVGPAATEAAQNTPVQLLVEQCCGEVDRGLQQYRSTLETSLTRFVEQLPYTGREGVLAEDAERGAVTNELDKSPARVAQFVLFMEPLQQATELGMESSPVVALAERFATAAEEQIALLFDRLTAKMATARLRSLDAPDLEYIVLRLAGHTQHMATKAWRVLVWQEEEALDTPAVVALWRTMLEWDAAANQRVLPILNQMVFCLQFLRRVSSEDPTATHIFGSTVEAQRSVQAMLVPAAVLQQLTTRCELVIDQFVGRLEELMGVGGKAYPFVPPSANSVSTVVFLLHMLTAVGDTLSRLGAFNVTTASVERLRKAATAINFKFQEAMCAQWVADLLNFHRLEKTTERDHGLPTEQIPETAATYMEFVTTGLRRLGEWLEVAFYEVRVIGAPSKRFEAACTSRFQTALVVLLEAMMVTVVETERQRKATNVVLLQHEAYKLEVISLLGQLREVVLPRIVKRYDALFDTKLQGEQLKAVVLLDKFEKMLFELFMATEKLLTRKVFDHKVMLVAVDAVPRGVGEYVYRILARFVEVAAECTRLLRSQWRRIALLLQEFVLKEWLDYVRMVYVTGHAGNPNVLAQLQVDVDFFVQALRRLGDTSRRLAEAIVNEVAGEVGESALLPGQIDGIVSQALKDTEVEYACLDA